MDRVADVHSHCSLDMATEETTISGQLDAQLILWLHLCIVKAEAETHVFVVGV